MFRQHRFSLVAAIVVALAIALGVVATAGAQALEVTQAAGYMPEDESWPETLWPEPTDWSWPVEATRVLFENPEAVVTNCPGESQCLMIDPPTGQAQLTITNHLDRWLDGVRAPESCGVVRPGYVDECVSIPPRWQGSIRHLVYRYILREISWPLDTSQPISPTVANVRAYFGLARDVELRSCAGEANCWTAEPPGVLCAAGVVCDSPGGFTLTNPSPLWLNGERFYPGRAQLAIPAPSVVGIRARSQDFVRAATLRLPMVVQPEPNATCKRSPEMSTWGACWTAHDRIRMTEGVFLYTDGATASLGWIDPSKSGLFCLRGPCRLEYDWQRVYLPLVTRPLEVIQVQPEPTEWVPALVREYFEISGGVTVVACTNEPNCVAAWDNGSRFAMTNHGRCSQDGTPRVEPLSRWTGHGATLRPCPKPSPTATVGPERK